MVTAAVVEQMEGETTVVTEDLGGIHVLRETINITVRIVLLVIKLQTARQHFPVIKLAVNTR